MVEREQSGGKLEGQEAEIPMDAETARKWIASLEKLLDKDSLASLELRSDLAGISWKLEF